MERQIGIGVIGMGWMGRVHSASYRRLPEHFPDPGVRSRLLMAADVSEDRRRHAERIGFETTTDDGRVVVEDPRVDVVNVTLPNALHREVARGARGRQARVGREPVGRAVEDTAAVAEAANRAGAAASWRFSGDEAGSGALGDLMAHVVDMSHHLVGPIDRLSGRIATMFPRRPRLPIGEGTHFSRVATDDLVDVDNEDWAAALIEFGAARSARSRRAA